MEHGVSNEFLQRQARKQVMMILFKADLDALNRHDRHVFLA